VTKPLDGIRVVDLTRMIVGPTATMLLADMGADVVKIEPPAGDDVRYMQTSYDPEYCPFFLAVNRNKRGVVLDLTSPEGPVRTYEQVHADPPTYSARVGISYRAVGVLDGDTDLVPNRREQLDVLWSKFPYRFTVEIDHSDGPIFDSDREACH